MEVLSVFRETVAGLRSDRAAARKGSAEGLKSYLEGDAVPGLLSKNTIKQSGYNWGNLFEDVFQYALKESEKFETLKTFESVIKPTCSLLLNSVVLRSYKDKAFISSDKITSACLHILKDRRLQNAFGDTFLNLLYKHVLPYEYYLASILPETYKDLLKVCINQHLSGKSVIDEYANLRLVLVLIQGAVSNCQFLTQLVEFLPQIRSFYTLSVTDKKVQVTLVEIAALLTEQLASEYRLTICEFTESITPIITRYYEQNCDKKKKEYLFQFFFTTVIVHHPEGKLRNEDGCTAHKWSKWRNQLNNILEIIQLEVASLQKAADSKYKFHEVQSQKANHYFVNLAAYVYYVVLNSKEETDNSSGPSLKRIRSEFNRYQTFEDLIYALQQNPIPWLKIIFVYIEKFGRSLTNDDYIKILNILEMYVSNNNTNINWGDYNNVTILILNKLTESQDNEATKTLWKTIVRHSTSVNSAHKSLHSIMHTILDMEILNSTQVLPLIKMYGVKGIPVTNSSVATLNTLLHKYFSKFSSKSERALCFEWLINGEYNLLDDDCLKELLIRIISKENINVSFNNKIIEEQDVLLDTLFKSVEKCILFNEFELELNEDNIMRISNDCGVYLEDEPFGERISEIIDSAINSLENDEMQLLEFIKETRIALQYCDIILKYKIVTPEQITNMKLFNSLKSALKLMFVQLTERLTPNLKINLKVELLQCIQTILNYNYVEYMSEHIRLCMTDGFFHKIETIMNSDTNVDDIEVMDTSDDCIEINCDLKFICIYLLASYCKKKCVHRSEILDLILNSSLYNFARVLDVNIAVKCMRLLIKSDVEQPPLDKIFTLLKDMCKSLFRNVEATYHILDILFKIMDALFMSSPNKIRNCVFMIKGYLTRCLKLHYPPYVAAVIYKCAAKALYLIEKQGQTDMILDANLVRFITEALQASKDDNINSLRIYCCHLLTRNTTYIDSNIHTALNNIFSVNISDKTGIVLTDELKNRTATVLHCLIALTTSKQNLTLDIVKSALRIYYTKNLDHVVVKKVLTKIIETSSKKSLEQYMCNNLSQIMEFWFKNGHTVVQLPITFFGFESMVCFLDAYYNMILPIEILSNKQGNYDDSDITPLIKDASKETILENCFPHTIALCLPYVACDHYNMKPTGMDRNTTENAKRLFKYCTQTIDNNKFSTLVIDNIDNFVLLCATKLFDCNDIKEMFGVSIKHEDCYCYNLEVFGCALRYLGEIISTNVMQHLSEKQPFAVSKILIQLWTYVTDENISELKIISLYRFIIIFQLVPLNTPCDSFLANFACNSLMYAIKKSNEKKNIVLFAKALHLVLNHLLPRKLNIIREVMPSIISTLIIKKEEGYGSDCIKLLNYLLIDMKSYLKESIDLVDSSQNIADNSFYSTKGMIVDNLKSYVTKLPHYSFETLYNLREYLKSNQQSIQDLYTELDEIKGFSEDSTNSLIHQLINALIHIVKTSTDQKNRTEACNCLAEIGACDLKTLVMMPPKETEKVTDLTPAQYFAVTLITCLSDVIFDQDPAVVNCAVNSISSLLSYKEGKKALDSLEINKETLEPFAVTQTTNNACFSINTQCFNSFMNVMAWSTSDNETYDQWLIKITSVLLKTLSSNQNYLPKVIEMCNTKPILCEKLLPSLVGLLIYHSSKAEIKVISTTINNVFGNIVDSIKSVSGEDSYSSGVRLASALSHKQKLIIQCMLDIVDFVRLQRKHYKEKWTSNAIESCNYLKLDYKSVSSVANVIDQSITAVFYGELWCVSQNAGVPPSSPEETSKLDGGQVMQKILRNAFVSIGDVDAIAGCGTDHLTNEDERRKYLMRSGLFADSLLAHDIGLTFASTMDTNACELHYGIVESLYESGMHHIAQQYIKSLPDNTELDDMKYECCTQLGDWSIFVDTTDLESKSKSANVNLDSLIKAFRYACLKDCLTSQNTHENDKLLRPLEKAKHIVSLLCEKLNMNNCKNVYKVVSKLQLFKDIEDYHLVRADKASFTDLLDNWQMINLPKYYDMKYVEALLSQRSLILDHAAKTNRDLVTDIVNVQLSYAELFLENGKSHSSHRYIALAKKLKDSGEVSLVEGQLHWNKGHNDIALSLIRRLTTEESNNKALTAAALRQYGNWMVESKYESGKEIIDKYLKRSLDVLGPNGHVDTRLRVYYDIAKFADSEYRQVVSYMKSSVFTNKVNCMEAMKGVATSMKNSQLGMSRDEKKAQITNEKLSTIDEAEIQNTFAEKERLLRLAMRYYLLALGGGEENNLSIFKVISLWFENEMLTFEDNQETFEDLLFAVPTRKFLSVLPQLAPRLTIDNKPIDKNLKAILCKCAKDHPHHTLPILFGLKNSNKDLQINNPNYSSQMHNKNEESRVTAARRLVKQIKENDENMTVIVDQMSLMCDAIISFAYYKQESNNCPKYKIPNSEPISKLTNLNAIPVPTITLAIRNDCTYSDIISIQSFCNEFSLVGGINCPKKMFCLGSDGKNRTLLVKGEDDLRQDAVMQQVFTILNTLLETNAVTSKYKLLVRTYKVVPLSRRSGVLEWCEGTMPLGQYLVGTRLQPGAHKQYRPTDISCAAARSMMESCKLDSNAVKLKKFMKILQNFKPVFHYFFTEHYLDAVTWYERRQAYVKSVAASSMVGYILGLGDRHVQNILIDKNTAEVIHIDFGIAFDQGKVLPTPETVPFRLTQDIIAGFGPSGVEGNFRRCCEKTMQLLRDNHDTLLTILEVLLCDPLYVWSLTPGQAKGKQNITTTAKDSRAKLNIETRTSVGGPAQRALLAVSSKLNGVEAGGAHGVLVPGQVARLLRHAMDPANLSRLFSGWQAYL